MGSRLLMALSSVRYVRVLASGLMCRATARRVNPQRPMGEGRSMNARRACAAAAGLWLAMGIATTALAQKQGGVLRVFHRDSPASMSILEEGSISVIMPMMGVFNNLVLFDQHKPQNRV